MPAAMIFVTTRAAAGRLAALGDKSGVSRCKVKAPRAALGACLKAMSPARPSLTVRGAAGDDVYMARDAGQVSSPFSQANVHRSVEDAASQVDGSLELTTENADKVLDKVRPYLVADGGNCAVAGISNGVVMVELQGACGSCPSSTATMKMGIEQALRAAFGDKVTQVVQVGRAEEPVTVDTVNEHLEMLRPAITAYGGNVNVLSVKGEVCFVQFSGPPPIAQGVQAAIKDKFPTITTVEFQE